MEKEPPRYNLEKLLQSPQSPTGSTPTPSTGARFPAEAPAAERPKSLAWAPYGIAAALIAAEQVLGTNELQWSFPAGVGQQFAQALPGYRGGVADPRLMSDILKTIAQADGVDLVNKFLRDQGYSIQLRPGQPMPEGFLLYVASVLDLAVQWEHKGTPTELVLQGAGHQNVTAAHVKKGVAFYHAEQLPENRLVVNIGTQGNADVYLANYDGPVAYGFELEGVIGQLAANRKRDYNPEWSGVIFPMVDFAYKGAADWFVGASAKLPDGRPVVITQALLEQRLRMNEAGARAQQAFAATFKTLGMPSHKEPYKLDGQQLLVWFERPDDSGKNKIVYSAIITPEHMRNPGSLT